MTEKDRELQELRRTNLRLQTERDYLTRSETVQYYLRKNDKGEFLNDITALDRGIRDLHTRCREAEKNAQTYMAEAVYYRRKAEALEIERREAEENQFPLFNSDNRADENQHAEAAV